MPTYQYACTDCNHAFDRVQRFSEDSLTVCPACEGRLRKIFNAVGVVFKGSGFYRNDSRADAKSASAKSTSSNDSSGSKSTASDRSASDSSTSNSSSSENSSSDSTSSTKSPAKSESAKSTAKPTADAGAA